MLHLGLIEAIHSLLNSLYRIKCSVQLFNQTKYKVNNECATSDITVVKYNMSVQAIAGLIFDFTYVKMKGPNKHNSIQKNLKGTIGI